VRRKASHCGQSAILLPSLREPLGSQALRRSGCRALDSDRDYPHSLTYKVSAHGFDEPCHIAADIEYLDKGTYTLDPVHPPLSRIAIGVRLYLAGKRFPHWPTSDPRIRNYNDVGNSVLYDAGHYRRNLWLARSAILPFFGLAVVLVFLWTRREFGDFAGVMAALLFTTLPIVLAFSGLAYTDLPTACMQVAALFAFTTWHRSHPCGRPCCWESCSCTCSKHCPQRSPAAGPRFAAGRSHFLGAE
jgi:hypothetical protein